MKKTPHIRLVLITAALASCHHSPPAPAWQNGNNTYIRGDSTAPYTRMYHHPLAVAALWYFAFRPYGLYQNGVYHRTGYYSDALSEASNIGHNSFKSNTIRGGFGKSSFSVES